MQAQSAFCAHSLHTHGLHWPQMEIFENYFLCIESVQYFPNITPPHNTAWQLFMYNLYITLGMITSLEMISVTGQDKHRMRGKVSPSSSTQDLNNQRFWWQSWTLSLCGVRLNFYQEEIWHTLSRKHHTDWIMPRPWRAECSLHIRL